MGDEIASDYFSQADFKEFKQRLAQETALLKSMFQQQAFSKINNIAGSELEIWLVDKQGKPASVNQRFLQHLNHPMIVPELANFNVEINTHPQALQGSVLADMQADLEQTWQYCCNTANQLATQLIMIGILPSVKVEQLCLDNISNINRYRALNEQILALRQGHPIDIDIQGKDTLKMQHGDVMLESATTSFQVHLQVTQAQAPKFYNLAKIVSAAMVALTANSPFLFGRQLWDETRIALFEQAVCVGGSDLTKRVTYGICYAQDSLMECFEANYRRYPVLLPQLSDQSANDFPHLRLHNGTIWRWNRPLIGFDADGTPHLRIEHRVIPAGPTVIDLIANMAFYFGLMTALAKQDDIEQQLPFNIAKHNFYQAAKYSLDADITWRNGQTGNIRNLLRQQLLPLAKQGLESLAIDGNDIKQYLAVIEGRLSTAQTGAAWQKAWVKKYGNDMLGLTQHYQNLQNSGQAVHEWTLNA